MSVRLRMARELLAVLEHEGVTVKIHGDHVRLSPKEQNTKDRKAIVRRFKAELIGLLEERDRIDRESRGRFRVVVRDSQGKELFVRRYSGRYITDKEADWLTYKDLVDEAQVLIGDYCEDAAERWTKAKRIVGGKYRIEVEY